MQSSAAVRIGQRGREDFQILKDGDRLQAGIMLPIFSALDSKTSGNLDVSICPICLELFGQIYCATTEGT